MAVMSVVKLSELEGARRIEAEYYQPYYVGIHKQLISKNSVNLKYFCHFIKKGIFDLSPSYYCESGMPFIRTTEIKSKIADLNSVVFIPHEIHIKNQGTELDSGDIVFTKIGANIGDCAILPRKYPIYNFSQNVAGAKIITNKISPYYLAALLSSTFGRAQLQRVQMLSGQGKLELIDIKHILVYKASQELQDVIEKTYIFSEKQIEHANSLYLQAESLLLEELGLKDFKPEYKLSYTGNLSDAFSVHRVDAEYFQPAYELVVKKIKKYPNGFTKLLKCVENVKSNYDPTKYPNQTFSYVELADIDSSIGVIHSINEIKGEEAPSRARRILKERDVIVSSVEGSLEKVGLIDKEHGSCLASTGFFQFRPLNILPEVLLILSKTIVLQSQLKKQCSGTILTAVPKESLRDIVIPIIPDKTQQKIASLVQQSHEARKKATELLEIAKGAVEIAIEKNEKEALSHIRRF